MNTDASILVYKFRPDITGFNMYAEYTQLQLTFLALYLLGCITHLLIQELEMRRDRREFKPFKLFILQAMIHHLLKNNQVKGIEILPQAQIF